MSEQVLVCAICRELIVPMADEIGVALMAEHLREDHDVKEYGPEDG